MQFDPRYIMQIIIQQDPEVMQRFKQFQEDMKNNAQMRQQYQNFRRNMDNPDMRNKAFDDVTRQVNSMEDSSHTDNNG